MPARDDLAGQRSISEQDRSRLLLEQSIGHHFTDGNSIKILQNGVQIFPAMLEAIDRASQRIDFATFVYWTGNIAERFAEALAKKARSGVPVRVLLDSFGSKKMDRALVKDMQVAGADVRWFRPLATWRIWRSDKRTHRKLLICDDDVAFTGGVGIAEEWEGDARNPQEWRDTHLALRGPAVTGLRAAFLDNWNEAGDWHFEKQVAEPHRQEANLSVLVVRASATIGWTDTAAMLRSLVSLSARRLRIVTAYFNPDDKLVDLLMSAAERGVDVQILVPGKYCDSRLSQLAGHQHIERLLEGGVRLWRYQKTMLHAKVMTVDSHVAFVGSANFNYRSMGKDEECSVIAISSELAEELDESFLKDCEVAEPYDLQDWRSRGALLRMQERCSRLIIEQL